MEINSSLHVRVNSPPHPPLRLNDTAQIVTLPNQSSAHLHPSSFIRADPEAVFLATHWEKKGSQTCTRFTYNRVEKRAFKGSVKGDKEHTHTHTRDRNTSHRKEEVTTKKMLLPYTFCHLRLQIFPCWYLTQRFPVGFIKHAVCVPFRSGIIDIATQWNHHTPRAFREATMSSSCTAEQICLYLNMSIVISGFKLHFL